MYLSNSQSLSALTQNSNPSASRPSTPTPPRQPQEKQPTPQPSPEPSQPSQEQPVRDEIAFSSSQQERITEIRQSYLAESSRLEGELNQARQELQEMMISDASTRQVRRQRNQVERLRQRISDNRFSSMMAVRDVMSVEQRTAFAESMDLDNADMNAVLTALTR